MLDSQASDVRTSEVHRRRKQKTFKVRLHCRKYEQLVICADLLTETRNLLVRKHETGIRTCFVKGTYFSPKKLTLLNLKQATSGNGNLN